MGIIDATRGRLRVQLVRAARKSAEAEGGTAIIFIPPMFMSFGPI
jgi:hypothetical protein